MVVLRLLLQLLLLPCCWWLLHPPPTKPKSLCGWGVLAAAAVRAAAHWAANAV